MKAIVLRVASPGGGRRGLSADRVQQIVRGRVWPGADAKERGLVDELGGLGTAMEVARERAGLPPSAQPELRTYPRVPLVAPAAHRPVERGPGRRQHPGPIRGPGDVRRPGGAPRPAGVRAAHGAGGLAPGVTGPTPAPLSSVGRTQASSSASPLRPCFQ
jgi:hypothetical protein